MTCRATPVEGKTMLRDADDEVGPGPPLPVGARGRVDARGRYIALNSYGRAPRRSSGLMGWICGLLLCSSTAADSETGSIQSLCGGELPPDDNQLLDDQVLALSEGLDARGHDPESSEATICQRMRGGGGVDVGDGVVTPPIAGAVATAIAPGWEEAASAFVGEVHGNNRDADERADAALMRAASALPTPVLGQVLEQARTEQATGDASELHERKDCNCGCLSVFRSFHAPKFLSICREVDLLWAAKQRGSAESDTAQTVALVGRTYQGTGHADVIMSVEDEAAMVTFADHHSAPVVEQTEIDQLDTSARSGGEFYRGLRAGDLVSLVRDGMVQQATVAQVADDQVTGCTDAGTTFVAAVEVNSTTQERTVPQLAPLSRRASSEPPPLQDIGVCRLQAGLQNSSLTLPTSWACGTCDCCNGCDIDEAVLSATETPLGVSFTPPKVKFEKAVICYAQELAQLPLHDNFRTGLCQEARASLLRVHRNFFTTKLLSLGHQSRAEVHGLSQRSTASKLVLTERSTASDLPICCADRCLHSRIPFTMVQNLVIEANSNTSAEERFQLRKDLAVHFPHLCGHARHLLLGASTGSTTVVDEELSLLLLEGISAPRVHGNTGREPANKLSCELRCCIQEHLECFTWCDPAHRSADGKVMRRPVSQDASEVSGLWALFQQFNCTAASQMSEVTFRCYIGEWLAYEHAKLYKCVSDHNCCKLCKRLQAQMHAKHREWTHAMQDVRQSELGSADRRDKQAHADKVHQEHGLFKDTLARHGSRNMILRGAKNRAKTVALAATLAGCNQTSVKHNDDKTPTKAPIVAKSASGMLHAYPVDVHGEFDLVDHTCSVYMPEPGAGSKDTNLTLDMILLDIINCKKDGEEILYLISDCGPHQHNSYMMAMAQWLVDHQFYSFVVLLYLEQEHSKEKCDMVFGVLTQAWRKLICITFECLGRAAARHPLKEQRENGGRGQTYRVFFVNSESCCDWVPHLEARYNKISGISRNGEAARNEHVMVFGHDLDKLDDTELTIKNSAGLTETTSQRAEIERLFQGDAPRQGWARLWNLPPPSNACDAPAPDQAGGGVDDCSTPLYAHLTPKYRDVLMYKENATFVPLGRRADAVVSSGDTKGSSMHVTESVKALIGWNASLTAFFDSDILDQRNSGDEMSLWPADVNQSDGYGKIASRNWHVRLPSVHPRYPSWLFATSKPHSTGGDEGHLVPQPNVGEPGDVVHDACPIHSLRQEHSAYASCVRDYNDQHRNIAEAALNANLYAHVCLHGNASALSADRFEDKFRPTPTDVTQDKAAAKRRFEEHTTRLVKPVAGLAAAYSRARSPYLRGELSGASEIKHCAAAEWKQHLETAGREKAAIQAAMRNKERFDTVVMESANAYQAAKARCYVLPDEIIVGVALRTSSEPSRHGVVTGVRNGMYEVSYEGSGGTEVVSPQQLLGSLTTADVQSQLQRTESYMESAIPIAETALVGATICYSDGTRWINGTVERYVDPAAVTRLQCDRCDAWHDLPSSDVAALADLTDSDGDLTAFLCEMNTWDPQPCPLYIAAQDETMTTIARKLRHDDMAASPSAAQLVSLNRATLQEIQESQDTTPLMQSIKLHRGTRVMLQAWRPSQDAVAAAGGYKAWLAREKCNWARRHRWGSHNQRVFMCGDGETSVAVDALELECLLVDSPARSTLRETREYRHMMRW